MPTERMTETWAERVKTDQPQEDWFDERESGLVLRVSRTGRKVWYLFYRPKGSKTIKRHKIGEYGDRPRLTLADAREQAKVLKGKVSVGDDPAGKRRSDREAADFKEVAELYIERYAKARKKSWQQDAWLLEKELLKPWSDKKAHLITKRDVIDLLHEIHDRPAPVLSNRTLALARKIFNWAISQDLVKTNPCDRIPAVGKETKRERVLTDDEIRKVWAVLDGQLQPEERINPLVSDILKVMLITGQRKGEIERMRWVDVDLDGGWWTIPTGDAKNARSHRVPLAPMALGILQARRKLLEAKAKKDDEEVTEWVFPGHGTDGPIVETKKSIANAQKYSKVDGWTPHDLRRTVASNLGRMGIAPSTIARCLNHKDTSVPDVTWTYIQYQYDQEKRQALDAWADKLQEILGAKRTADLPS